MHNVDRSSRAAPFIVCYYALNKESLACLSTDPSGLVQPSDTGSCCQCARSPWRPTDAHGEPKGNQRGGYRDSLTMRWERQKVDQYLIVVELVSPSLFLPLSLSVVRPDTEHTQKREGFFLSWPCAVASLYFTCQNQKGNRKPFPLLDTAAAALQSGSNSHTQREGSSGT